jgi:hypothetical protein
MQEIVFYNHGPNLTFVRVWGNQSIDQSIDRSINQLINQPVLSIIKPRVTQNGENTLDMQIQKRNYSICEQRPRLPEKTCDNGRASSEVTICCRRKRKKTRTADENQNCNSKRLSATFMQQSHCQEPISDADHAAERCELNALLGLSWACISVVGMKVDVLLGL